MPRIMRPAYASAPHVAVAPMRQPLNLPCTPYAVCTVHSLAEGRAESNRPALTVTGRGSPGGQAGPARGPQSRAQGRRGAARAAQAGPGLAGRQRGSPGRRICGCCPPCPKDMLLLSCPLTGGRRAGGQNCHVAAPASLPGPLRWPGGCRSRCPGQHCGRAMALHRHLGGIGSARAAARQAAVIRLAAPSAESFPLHPGLRPVIRHTPFGCRALQPNNLHASACQPGRQASGGR